MPDPYIHGHHDAVLRSHRWRTADNSAGYLVPHLAPGMSVIDVGCGPGTLTADLAGIVAPGRVVGVDAAEAVLAEARAATTHLDGVSIESGTVYELGFEDGAFDVAHAHQVLQHLTDPVAALREMARVTRPGGLVAVRDADYGAMTWWPRPEGMNRWLALYRSVARANGGEPDGGRRVLSWAHAADVGVPLGSGSTWVFATPADRAWWGGLWAERITSSELANRATALGFADRPELEGMAAAWRQWADAEDGWFAVLHGEVLIRVGQNRQPVRNSTSAPTGRKPEL